MAVKDNFVHVMVGEESSQRYRYLTPVVESEDDIKRLLNKKYIDDNQARLLWLIDIKKQSFSYVAKSANCSRQNVHHIYNSIRKTIKMHDYRSSNQKNK